MTWAEAEAGILFRGRLWQRELDRRGRRVRSEDVQLVEWEGGAGFQTVPPNTLAARGFAERGADGRPRIYGLDARTVLSDAFLSGHCFRVVLGEEERAGDVGLAFEPASRSGRIVDVEGVLWVDASTAMLEELEYRFTNLELVGLSEGERSSALVEFTSLASGEWISSRWWIRIPLTRSRWTRRPGGRSFGPSVYAIHEEGGEVSHLVMPDGATLSLTADPP